MIGRSSLTRVIYFSRSKLAADPVEHKTELEKLIRSSQKKNEFAVVTSLLVEERGWFLQVLEGDRNAIYDAVQRIHNDTRHKDIRICEWREVPKREFVSSMIFVTRNPANEPIFARFNVVELLQRGTPKPSVLHAFVLALQGDTLAKQGIELLV